LPFAIVKSDLAKSVKGVALPDQDDTFLVSHFLAGAHEVDELDTLIEALKDRRSEARAIKDTIERTLRDRFRGGKNFTVGTALLQIPSQDAVDDVTIAQTEVLGLATEN
jgi:predicted RNA-binding Zn ribbon-like protein